MNKIPADQLAGNTLSFIYLFIHLLIVAAVIYLALKSYFQKDQLLSVFMTTEHGRKNEKSYRNCLLFTIIFGILGIFFFLNAFSIIAVTAFLSLGLNLALTNVFLSVSVVALCLLFYKAPESTKTVDVKPIE